MSLVEFSQKHKVASFLIFALVFAILSTVITIGILLASRLGKKGNLVKDLAIFDGKLTLISGVNYWFVACVVSSILIFVFKYAFMAYKKKYLSNTKCEGEVFEAKTEDEVKAEKKAKRNELYIFLATLAGDLLKTLIWPIAISIITTIDFKKSSPKIYITAIAILVALVILSHFHHCLSTNAIFGSVFFQNENDNKAISAKKKAQYIGCIFFASVVAGLLFATIRLSIPQIFYALHLEYNLPLGPKNLDILTNSHSFLAVCIVDCLCLVLGFILINWLSKKMFVKLVDNEKNKEALKEFILKNHKFDLNAIKTNFGFIKTFFENSQDFSQLNKFLKQDISDDKELSKTLQEIFLNENDIATLRKEIKNFRKSLKKCNLTKEQLKIIDISLDNLESQFLVVKTKDKAKSYGKRIALSVASTVAFHILTQMQASINKYGITDWRNILEIATFCVIVLMVAFALHLESGNALVGSESIFRNQDKPADWYKNLWEQDEYKTLRDEIINRLNEKKENKGTCCGAGCDGHKKFTEYIKKNKININESEYNIVSTDNTITDDNKLITCGCETCCMPTILKNIVNDKILDNDIRETAYILYNKAINSNTEKNSRKDTKMSGGSCPCSNLAKSQTESYDDFMLNKHTQFLLLN
jgi:hypothetical protein